MNWPRALKGGADFATVAKVESADAGSAAQGGDLGAPFKHGQMVKPFEQAAFSLPVGQISEPVKTQFGYHIIRVDKIETKPFDEAKAELEARLKPELAKKQMDELKAGAGVKLDDTFFGPPAPPAGSAPAPQWQLEHFLSGPALHPRAVRYNQDMASQPHTLITAEQFYQLPQEEGREFELLDGDVIEMPSPTPRHNIVAHTLGSLLYPALQGRGRVIPETDFSDGRLTTLRPDLSILLGDKIHPA